VDRRAGALQSLGMTRPPSAADRDLELRLRALEIELSADRIQRFREVGLLLAPRPSYPGGGGSTGRYPPEVIDRVREAMELAEKPQPLYVAMLEMFGRGNFPIAESKLKAHLLYVLDRWERSLRDAAGAQPQTDPSDVAAEAAPALAKRIARDPRTRQMRQRIRRRSKQNPESRLDGLTDVMGDLASIFLTGEPLARDTNNLLEAVGLNTAFTGAGRNVDLPDVDEWFKPAQVDNIRSVISNATLAELEVARDDFKDLLACIAAARKLYRPTAETFAVDQVGGLRANTDLDYALGAVLVALLRSSSPDALEHFLPLARTKTLHRTKTTARPPTRLTSTSRSYFSRRRR
jgi:hypothetical protein